MGDLKKNRVKSTTKEFALASYDLDYIKEMVKLRNATYNSIQALIQAHLSYLAYSRWGYKENQLLEFEVDDEKELIRVKVLKEK